MLTPNYGLGGRMASSAQGSFSAAYAVNALGQRTFKEVATGPGPTLANEFSVYDEQGRLLGRYDGTGATLEELVYLDGFRPVATVRGSDIDRVLSDHLGTPRKGLDPTGTLLERVRAFRKIFCWRVKVKNTLILMLWIFLTLSNILFYIFHNNGKNNGYSMIVLSSLVAFMASAGFLRGLFGKGFPASIAWSTLFLILSLIVVGFAVVNSVGA